MSTFLTSEEEASLATCGLKKQPWYVIRNVSTSYFSTCRHFGGGIIQGQHYTYNPKTDELIRLDVLNWIMKRRKDTAKAERARLKELRAKQERDLFEESNS